MRQTSSGSVLLMVVIISAILYLMAATLLFLTSLEVHLADFEQRSTQAFYVAESSLAYGLATLRTNAGHRAETTTDFHDLGGNLAQMNVQFRELPPSLYHIILRGTGTVTGVFSAATKRIVERDVTLKPFAVFARRTVTLKNGCTVAGNVHGNEKVILESGSVVTKWKDLSSSVTSAVSVQNSGVITPPGIASQEEPEIAFPKIDFDLYTPRYWYEGQEYSAGSLNGPIQVALDTEAGAPFDVIDVYWGKRSDETNPVGIFEINAPLAGEHTALIVDGTVIVRSSGVFAVNGLVSIAPLETSSVVFPAIISKADLHLQFYSGLEQFSKEEGEEKILRKNGIQGLVYSQSSIWIEPLISDVTGKFKMTGSIFGDTVILTNVSVEYTPDIIAKPPPGLDLIDLGAWREVLPE